MKENIEIENIENYKYNPKIDKKSEKMMKKRKYDDLNIHERLFGISRKIKDSKKEDDNKNTSYLFPNDEDKNDEYTFHPEINKKSKNILRVGKIEDRLYNYGRGISSGVTISSYNSNASSELYFLIFSYIFLYIYC